MIAGDYSSEEYVEMHKMLFNPFQLYDKGFIEKTVRGALNTSVEKVDTYFNSEFTERLFERKVRSGAYACIPFKKKIYYNIFLNTYNIPIYIYIYFSKQDPVKAE